MAYIFLARGKCVAASENFRGPVRAFQRRLRNLDKDPITAY